LTVVKQIPEVLIYEMDNGKPIYYSKYKSVLQGNLSSEAIMGSSILQSLIITELIVHFTKTVSSKYFILSNEIGILFSKGSWRLADIAIIEKSRITEINDKYISAPPNVVIEVDTKAALEDYDDPKDYYTLKTQQYLDFGVNKVIWIYTKTKTIEIATKKDTTQHFWSENIEFLNELNFNLEVLMQDHLS